MTATCFAFPTTPSDADLARDLDAEPNVSPDGRRLGALLDGYLTTIGARRIQGVSPRWLVPTRAGQLRLRLFEPQCILYGRFLRPGRAAAVVVTPKPRPTGSCGLGAETGVWNHLYDQVQPEEALRLFQADLAPILDSTLVARSRRRAARCAAR